MGIGLGSVSGVAHRKESAVELIAAAMVLGTLFGVAVLILDFGRG